MSKRTQPVYEDVFGYLMENIFPLDRVKSFTSDYELAMRNALSKMFPAAELIACYFHYTQAIKRSVSKLPEMLDAIKADEKAKSIYYRIQCLPLLPPDNIEMAFQDLCNEAKLLERSVKKALGPFFTYVRRQWIKKVCFRLY